jgi:hypothetical protein
MRRTVAAGDQYVGLSAGDSRAKQQRRLTCAGLDSAPNRYETGTGSHASGVYSVLGGAVFDEPVGSVQRIGNRLNRRKDQLLRGIVFPTVIFTGRSTMAHPL